MASPHGYEPPDQWRERIEKWLTDEGPTPIALEVLADMARAAEYPNVGTYLRGIIEREVQACRPEDFKRLRGVG